MKKGMMVILAMLVLLAGCFNDGMKEKKSEAREKFVAFLDSMGNAEKTKRDTGDTQEGVYVTVGSDLKFYSLENVLFTMTQTEKFALADQLEAASKIAEAKAHLVFGKFCLGFSDLMAGRDFNTPNLPLANTIIIRPNPTPVPVPTPTPLPTTGSWIVIVQQQDIYAGGLVYFGGSVSKDIVKITATVDGVAVTAVVQSRGSMSATSSMTIRGQAVTAKKDAVLNVTGMNAAGAVVATATTLFEIKDKANPVPTPVPTPTPTPTPNPIPVPNTGSWISIVQQQDIYVGGLVYFGGSVSKDIVKITATVDGVAVTAVVQSRGSMSTTSSMTIRGQAVTAKKDAVLKVTGMNAAGAVVATATTLFEIKDKANPVPTPVPTPTPTPTPNPTPVPNTGSWISIVQQQEIYAGGLVYFGGSVSKDIVKITATVDGVAVTAVVQSRGSMSAASSMTIRGQAVTAKKDAILKVTGMNAAGAVVATATSVFEIK